MIRNVIIVPLLIAVGVVHGNLDVRLTQKANEIYASARTRAEERGNVQIDTLHFALVLFEADSEGTTSFATKIYKKAAGGNPTFSASLVSATLRKFERKVAELPTQRPPPASLDLSASATDMFVRAEKERASLKDTTAFVGVDHILLAAVDDRKVNAVLRAASKDPSIVSKIKRHVRAVRRRRHRSTTSDGSSESSSSSSSTNEDVHTDESFFALETFATELVEEAAKGTLDPVFGRDQEIRRVIQILSRRKKNNPVLVGSPGVGKTAIVEGLALRIHRGEKGIPTSMKRMKIFALDFGRLLAGASAPGQFEARLKAVIGEVEDTTDAVLFIDELHILLSSSGKQSADLLKPALARGKLKCIGATTIAEFRRVENDRAFERRFQKVNVEEPNPEKTLVILRGLREKYEAFHGVRILDDALVAAAKLSHRYISGRFNPDKSIDLIDEACARLRVQLESQPAVVEDLERRHFQLTVERAAASRDLEEEERSTSGILGSVLGTLWSTKRRRGGQTGESALSPESARVKSLDAEISTVKVRLDRYRTIIETERERIANLREILQDIEGLKKEVGVLESSSASENDSDASTRLEHLSKLLHHTLPDLERRRDEAIASIERHRREHQGDEDELRELLVTDVVTRDHVSQVVSVATGIPVSKLTRNERQKMLGMAERLGTRVIGQPEAVRLVADSILRSSAGLDRGDQPIYSAMFAGRSGVGKTELAKALAEQLFDDENAIVRLDMSEYHERHSLSRLIGAPPGYIGHDAGGQLTEAVRLKPYSVILCDEVEKAHRDIFNSFLQILDDGRLTDGKGTTVDFTNTVVLMTTNLGAAHLNAEEGDMGKRAVMQSIRTHFRPEFLNRLDDIVVFKTLNERDLEAIASLMIKDLRDRIAEASTDATIDGDTESAVRLEVTPEAIRTMVRTVALAEPEYGARPLKRFVDKTIATEVAMALLRDEGNDGEAAVDACDAGVRIVRVDVSEEDPDRIVVGTGREEG
eukprot:g1429.t1